jgi:hypothetical protein
LGVLWGSSGDALRIQIYCVNGIAKFYFLLFM